jgi:hypothetical protein
MDASRGEGEWVVSMANLTLLTATVVHFLRRPIPAIERRFKCIKYARHGTEKVLARQTVFAHTTRTNFLSRARARASASARLSSIGENKNRARKIFLSLVFRLLIAL